MNNEGPGPHENGRSRPLEARSDERKPPPLFKPSVVTIPGHPDDDVSTGTLKAILKGAGVEKKAMSVRYAVIFEQAENNWAAYVPDLPGCITAGKTLEDAERDIREAIEGHLKTLHEFGDPIPQPTSAAREIEIQPAA